MSNAVIEATGAGVGIVVPTGNGWVDLEELRLEARRKGVTKARIELKDTMTTEEAERLRKIRNSKWFLVRNDGKATGERWPCKHHRSQAISRLGIVERPTYHDYFTRMCRPLPMRGLVDALWAYATVSHDAFIQRKLLQWAPDLATGHPLSARDLRPKEPSSDVIAIALGVSLEPIPEWKARQLAMSINAMRPEVPVIV